MKQCPATFIGSTGPDVDVQWKVGRRQTHRQRHVFSRVGQMRNVVFVIDIDVVGRGGREGYGRSNGAADRGRHGGPRGGQRQRGQRRRHRRQGRQRRRGPGFFQSTLRRSSSSVQRHPGIPQCQNNVGVRFAKLHHRTTQRGATVRACLVAVQAKSFSHFDFLLQNGTCTLQQFFSGRREIGQDFTSCSRRGWKGHGGVHHHPWTASMHGRAGLFRSSFCR